MKSTRRWAAAAIAAFVLFPVNAALAQETPTGAISAVDLMRSDFSAVRGTTTNKGDFFLSLGNWFDKNNPGWGLDIQSVGDSIFAVWFTYNPDGTPTWYIIVGQLAAKGDAMSLTGNIEFFKWDVDFQSASAAVVGTMTIAWSDENNAEASWTLNGEDGSASISFAQFAPGVTYSNMTGHYFSPNSSGWGYTLLTQGDVTVFTMYWYKDGQPVWAQGVLPVPVFDEALYTLNYFLGPDLCPSCLGGKSTFTAEPLVDVTTRYTSGAIDPLGVEGPVVDIQLEWVGTPGDQLGPEPFGDIGVLNITDAPTTAITAAALDNFNPDYPGLRQLASDLGLGNCLGFEYDIGIFGSSPTGNFEQAWFMLEPTEDLGMGVYADAKCTTPFAFPYPIESMSQLWLTNTGGSAVVDGQLRLPIQLSWGGSTPFQDDCLIVERLMNSGYIGDTPDGIEMLLFGFARPLTINCPTSRLADALGSHVDPPSSADITDGVLDKLFIRATYTATQ